MVPVLMSCPQLELSSVISLFIIITKYRQDFEMGKLLVLLRKLVIVLGQSERYGMSFESILNRYIMKLIKGWGINSGKVSLMKCIKM